MNKIVYILVFFYAQLAVSGSIHENIPEQKYIDLANQISGVVMLNIVMDDKTEAIGSGVVIDKRWVLTVAHALTIANKIYIKDNNVTYNSIKIIPHEEFNYDQGTYDIGLLKLDKDFILNHYPIISKKSSKEIEGKKILMCGYGTLLKANDPKFETLDFKLRAGTNIVDSIEDHLFICSMSKNNPTEAEYVISGGDSGGAMLLDNELIGINSCAISLDGKTDGSYNDQSGHTRLELFREWIEQKQRNN